MAPSIPVTYLFSRECPSHEEGRRLLDDAAEAAGVGLDVDEIEVQTDAQAEDLGFAGSPTYLLDGVDMADVDESLPMRSEVCRAYHRPDGRIAPLPTLSQLVAALQAAAGRDDDREVTG